MSAFRAFKIATDKLKQHINMIMFPEGGIANDYPPQVQAFKNGPFRLAIELGVPIIPITSLNTWNIMWDDGLKFGTCPGVCKIYVNKPVETSQLKTTDADALKDMVSDIIKNKFDSLNK